MRQRMEGRHNFANRDLAENPELTGVLWDVTQVAIEVPIYNFKGRLVAEVDCVYKGFFNPESPEYGMVVREHKCNDNHAKYDKIKEQLIIARQGCKEQQCYGWTGPVVGMIYSWGTERPYGIKELVNHDGVLAFKTWIDKPLEGEKPFRRWRRE